uniref:FA complementation group C n=1 Tax=Sphaeramia orbicularis TaxID=375764 RepID=A0A672ZP69_9TELE
MAEPLISVQEMQLWLEKVMAWGQADSPDNQRDICLHLSRLRDFLQKLLTHIEAMKTLPLLGQFLGQLCWIPYVTADGDRALLFQCLWGLYSEHPDNAMERKANQWIRKVLCQITTDDDDGAAQALLMDVGLPPAECSCDRILATSEACVPLVTCPEAASLIGALLQTPLTCTKAALSEDFLDALSSRLSLEEQAVVSLWYHSLSSLEEAVLSLLESVLANTRPTPQRLEQQLAQSLLKFSCLFQKRVPLKAFFPQSPQSLLVPLLTKPSGKCVCTDILMLQFVLLSYRGHHKLFEAWFLLVRCAHWVEVAIQLLVTAGSEDCSLLLWLLSFYHHPTNRGHHRDEQLVRIKEAWDHLHSVFSSLAALLSSQPQLPSPAPVSILNLLVNSAVFSQQSLNASTEIFHTVRKWGDFFCPK